MYTKCKELSGNENLSKCHDVTRERQLPGFSGTKVSEPSLEKINLLQKCNVKSETFDGKENCGEVPIKVLIKLEQKNKF